ncbi:hypothetical protein FV233_08010 [Methylobacterium sp. WL7]|nr:hypothetical protein FV233_08010 [Methylobacterium sp. WL7]
MDADGRQPADQVVQVRFGPGAGTQAQVLPVPGAIQDQPVGEPDRRQADRRSRDQARCGERREAEGQEQRGERHCRQDDAGGEQPVAPSQNLADQAGEAAGLVPGSGRRVEDRLQDALPHGVRGPVLRLEAQARHDPADSGERQRAGGDAQEGGELQLRRAHWEAVRQHDVAAGQRQGEPQERQRRRLVARQHRDEIAQTQQGERAERGADPDREGGRCGVQAPRRAPGQDDGVGIHRGPRQVRGGAATGNGAAAPDGSGSA